MISPSSRPGIFRSWQSWAHLTLLGIVTVFLGGCAGTTQQTGGTYHVDAYAPTSPQNVHVYVSIKAAMVYVMEGSKPLLVTPTTVGTPEHPTPLGNFHVTSKNPVKRSGEYGFWVNGNDAHPGSATASPGPGWTYVGYPMAYWVEFEPGFGFHEGYVWPIPHSHGCLRLHRNAAPKFFQLVQVGTPVTIAQSLPEDATLGKNVNHPTDYNDPDPPAARMISPNYFKEPRDNQLIPQNGTASATPAPAAQ